MALPVDENLNSTLLQGLLTEAHRQRPISIRSEPLANFYNVEARPFARGKFATVRRCHHKETGIDYAAKYIRKRRRATDVRHEIMHEACVLDLSANNPHIVQLHEVFETQSEIILVLEMVPGGELQRVLDDEEVVPERDAARLMRQILAGLSFLHDHKIAHLDLKPQNLLLTKPFPHCEVKLCDFGISRLINKGMEIREIVGTPDYVAPEVLHYEPISLATDMWSIGILTYVLLSGHSPFGGDTKQETFCNITRGTLEFPSDLFSSVSNDAKDFIRRLLVRNPRERMSAKECLSHPWLTQDVKIPQGIAITLTPSGETREQNDSSPTDTPPSLVEDKASPTTHQSPALRERVVTVHIEHKPQQVLPSTDLKCNKLTVRRESLRHQMASQCESETNGNRTDQNGVRSIEQMERVVVDLEELTMTKRIIFTEEIIVDERVGIVY